MNAEFLEKELTFEPDPEHPGRIKPFTIRKGLSHKSFAGAIGTLDIEGIAGCAIVTGAYSDNNGVFFQGTLSDITITCQYNPETGVIVGAIATS